MKILLINPHYYTFSSFTYFEKFFDPIPVMGLGYMAAVLRKNNHEVVILDDYIERKGIQGILDLIKEIQPSLVGISCLTPYANETYYLSREIKSAFPSITLVLGHRHADYFSETILQNRIADIVVHGEGEETLLDITKALETHKSFSTLLGISYWDGKNAIKNPPRPYIENLDTIPFPAWDLFKLDRYRPCPEVVPGKGRVMPLLTSRGCPFSCIFCSQEMGKTVRFRSVDNILEEMVWGHEQLGVSGYILFDANFPLDKKLTKEFCNKMIEQGLQKKIKWTTETRPNLLDQELLILMKAAGCTNIQLGFESGSDRILKELHKGFTVEDSMNAARMIKKAGLSIYGLFIVGSPTETPEDIQKTIEFSKQMDLDYAKFNLFVPYPGTEAFENLQIKTKIKEQPWINFTSYPPSSDRVIYCPDNMTPQDLIYYQKKAFAKFYFRPKMIFSHIKKIRPAYIKDYWNGFLLMIGFQMNFFKYFLNKGVKKFFGLKS